MELVGQGRCMELGDQGRCMELMGQEAGARTHGHKSPQFCFAFYLQNSSSGAITVRKFAERIKLDIKNKNVI